MSAKPTAMEKLKQILQLHKAGQSIKAIARLTGVARNTVRTYLARSNDAECDIVTQSDKQLAGALYNHDTTLFKSTRYQNLLAYFEGIERQLSSTGVTRQLLWREYLDKHPDGYSHSQYSFYLQQYLGKKDVVMHLEYAPGEQIMVDFAGKRYRYTDPQTKEEFLCEVFVATLPFSGLIFCMAVPSQKTADFLDACNHMLKYFGGVTKTILCDNLRTVVTKSDRYEPVFTDLCVQLSEHYGTTFSAARPGKPRDKAMVEKAVSIVYRKVYAPLRDHNFTSLAEINHHFIMQLDLLNAQPYKGSSFSRKELFMQQEQAFLTALPASPCLLKKCSVLTVQRNYHVQLREEGRYYSTPWQYVGKKVKVWYDQKTVEIYHDHERIAIHSRSVSAKGYTTINDHMPANHQQARSINGFSKEDLLYRAKRVGSKTHEVAEMILSNSIYMEQNYKACFGMLMLEKRYGSQRLEAACTLALTGSRINYTMIKNMLQAGTDKQIRMPLNKPLPPHDNIRGPQNYQ